MSLRVWGVRVSRVLAVALIVLVGLPARADTSVDKARDAIDEVVEEAVSEMGEEVDEFASEIGDLSTSSAIAEAAASARDEVDAIRSEARRELTELMQEYPSSLVADFVAAKDAVEQARHDARSDIADLKESAIEQLASQATNTGPTPTPSPIPTPEGPVAAPPEPTPMPEDPVVAPPEPTPMPEVPGTAIETEVLPRDLSTESAGRLFMVDAIPDLTYTPASAGSTIEAMGAETTSAIARRFEVVLTPAIAELVLSPLLVFEILARTTLAGGWGNLFPLGLLVAFGALFFWADRRTKRFIESSLTVLQSAHSLPS